MSKIVCIYNQERDGTTAFLEPLVEHIKNMLAPVIVGYDIDSEDDPLEIIYQTILDADTIFFFGHGTSNRLYASTVDNLTLFDKNNIDLLSGKRLFLLSCNSADFIKKQRINKAFGFGMLPTSLDDARKWKNLHGIHIENFTKEDISIYNNAIVEILTHSIMVDSLEDYILLKERIKFQTSIEIVKCLTQHRNNVNYRILADLLYYFSKDIIVQ
jgi:hypothetical protein